MTSVPDHIFTIRTSDMTLDEAEQLRELLVASLEHAAATGQLDITGSFQLSPVGLVQ